MPLTVHFWRNVLKQESKADPKATTAGIEVAFESSDISATDWDKFLGGSFKVVIRGTGAPDFANKGAKADLQLTFTFAAFE